MKKFTCLLLALVMALAALVPAFAAQGDAVLGRGEEDTVYFNYCFTDGETLYLASYDSLYSYRPGDADLTRLEWALPEYEGEDNLGVDAVPFAAGGQLYAVVLRSRYDEHSNFEGAELHRLVPGGEVLAFEKVADLDWDDMVEYYDENSYANRPDAIVAVGDMAFMRCYDQQYEYVILALDTQTGDIRPVEGLQNISAFTAYRDGALLVEQYDYNDPEKAVLVVCDPADDSVYTLAEIAVESYSPLTALAYDPDTDTLYCAKGGEICPVDLQVGQVGEGVTDMPLETYGSGVACVLDGLYCYASQGAAVRSLDPTQRAATKLKISDNNWAESVTNAYYRFANTHGDVSVVLSREYSDVENLIEAMMNRDDSVDIYTLYTSSATYDALFNRGYLMELDGSAGVAALAERMYPQLREAFSQNGHVVALPVNVYSWTMGISEGALKRLGLTLEDVPGDWGGFLDFLAGLGDRLEEGGVHLFYSGCTDVEARNDLFNQLFDDYNRYAVNVNPGAGYNTPLLAGLLHKLEGIDFLALGCQEAQYDENGDEIGGYYEYEDSAENSILLETGTGCTFGNFYGDFTPLLLTMQPGDPAFLVLDTTVAVVNPFTKNPEAALAFMDELAGDLSLPMQYTLDPTLDEPVRDPNAEQSRQELQQMLDDLRAELETADPADKQGMEDDIRMMEQSLEQFDRWGWTISPYSVEWYRSHDDNLAVSGVNWLYNGDNGEAWELIMQYREGGLSAEEMLAGIDRKVQMMMLEGN